MIRYIYILLLSVFVQLSYAGVTSVDLMKLAKKYVRSTISIPVKQLHVTVSPFSSRLKLPACKYISFDYENPNSLIRLGKQTLIASCQKPYWHLYLQVNIYGKVPVVMSSKEIIRKEVFSTSNLKLKLVDSTKYVGPYFTSLKDFKRVQARTYIPAETIIRPEMVRKQYIVKNGSRVDIVSESGQIYVKMDGVALSSGMKGDIIRVKNTSSGRVLNAKIVNALLVKAG